MIGALVPGTGDPLNGMVLDTDSSYPDNFQDPVGLLMEPRLGVAYDLRGDGRTALRAPRTCRGGERTIDRWFDTSVFSRPAQGEVGNGRKDDVRLPGVTDTGIRISKAFRFGAREQQFEVSTEIYNLFNEVSYLEVDTTAQFFRRPRLAFESPCRSRRHALQSLSWTKDGELRRHPLQSGCGHCVRVAVDWLNAKFE